MRSKILVLLAAALIPAACGNVLANTPEQQLIDRFRKAVAARDDAEATRLMCWIRIVGVACGFDPERAYLEDVRTLWHRRYDAVFVPPANADAMTAGSWGDATPGLRYNRDGVASYGSAAGGDSARFFPRGGSGVPDATAPAFLVVQYDAKPYAVIDLDLDGRIDVTFDGAVEIRSTDLEMIADDAGDGERYQWRIGPKDSDVRDRPSIWVYRDACYYNLFVDTDGDGRGNCGGGGQLPEEGR